MTSYSYRGKINFKFSADKTKEFLGGNGIAYKDSYQGSILLIQFDENDNVINFNDMKEVQRLDFTARLGLSFFEQIAGDLLDDEILNSVYFPSAKYSDFKALNKRYGTSQIAIIKPLAFNNKVLLLIHLLGEKTDRIIYKYNDDNKDLAFIIERILDDDYKGHSLCHKAHEYFTNIRLDAGSLKVINSLSDCVTLNKKGNIYDMQFNEDPQTFSQLLAILGVQINKDGVATYVGK
jgi:hypothetical protein